MRLALLPCELWGGLEGATAIGGVFVCFGRGHAGAGDRGDPGWAGAAVVEGRRLVETSGTVGQAAAPYQAGFLALREGPLLEEALRRLRHQPDLLIVNATGRDHPRRAGLALHLGALLGLPTVGVTHRPLLAEGAWPDSDQRGARAPLAIGGECVGHWVRTRSGCRPVAVHAAWRTSPDLAAEAVLAATYRSRTPEPLRQARRVARTARSRAGLAV